MEEDEGEKSLFELTHEALGEREDEQELWKGQKNRQTDRQRETVSGSRSRGPGTGSSRERSSQGPWCGHAGTLVAGVGRGHPDIRLSIQAMPGEWAGRLRLAPPPQARPLTSFSRSMSLR